MAHIIELKRFSDLRGDLVAIQDDQIPFEIKRVYSILNPSGTRGGHRHVKTTQALICLSGSCVIYNNDGQEEQEFLLNSPTQCLILNPQDWHQMKDFQGECVLQVMASHHYNVDDYIDEPYN